MTENEDAKPRYIPACRDKTKIIPWYDFFLSKVVVVSASCREKTSKIYPSIRSPGKETPPSFRHLCMLYVLNPKLGDFFAEIGYGRSYLGQKRGRFAVSIVNLCRYKIGLIISATRDLPA